MRMEENLILVDFNFESDWDFKKNLEKKTGIPFKCILVDSNMWQGRISKFGRYATYFILPLYIMCSYKKVKNVVAWQQFYGLLYAFWCKLLHFEKPDKLIVTTFIYKGKKGLIGKIYKKFIKYIVESNVVDYFVCYSTSECEFYSKIFKNTSSKFVHCGLTETDLYDKFKNTIKSGDIYVAAGRSNRDYDFLCDAFKKLKNKKLVIICDNYRNANVSKNITILNNVYGEKYFEYVATAKAILIPLDTKYTLSSGQLVMIHSLMFGKICVVTDTNQSREYIENGKNGILINNNQVELESIITRIENGDFDYISNNARNSYVENYKNENLSKLIANIILGGL